MVAQLLGLLKVKMCKINIGNTVVPSYKKVRWHASDDDNVEMRQSRIAAKRGSNRTRSDLGLRQFDAERAHRSRNNWCSLGLYETSNIPVVGQLQNGALTLIFKKWRIRIPFCREFDREYVAYTEFIFVTMASLFMY